MCMKKAKEQILKKVKYGLMVLLIIVLMIGCVFFLGDFFNGILDESKVIGYSVSALLGVFSLLMVRKIDKEE